MHGLRYLLEDGLNVVEEIGILDLLVRKYSKTDSLNNLVEGYRDLHEEIGKFNVALQIYLETEILTNATEKAKSVQKYSQDEIDECHEWTENLYRWRYQILDKAGKLSLGLLDHMPRDDNFPHYEAQVKRFYEQELSFLIYLQQESDRRMIPEGGMHAVLETERKRGLSMLKKYMDDSR